MIHILKNQQNEPETLLQYRSYTNNAQYDGYTDRIKEPRNEAERQQKPLKEALCKEQLNRCCYCMREISVNSCSVEHYLPQSRPEDYPKQYNAQAESLNYMNMLASCNDSQRNCSGIRGNKYISIDPRQKLCEDIFRYTKDGKISIKDNPQYTHCKADIHILQLDTEILIAARKRIIKLISDELRKEGFSESAKAKARKKWETRAFSTVAIQYINSKKEGKV